MIRGLLCCFGFHSVKDWEYDVFSFGTIKIGICSECKQYIRKDVFPGENLDG